MANIDVVPKRRTNTWVWILLALLILAALLVLVFTDRGDASTMLEQFSPTIHAPARTVLLV